MQQYEVSKYDNIEPQIATIHSQKRLKSNNTHLAIIIIILDLIDVYSNVNTSYWKIYRLIPDNFAAQTLQNILSCFFYFCFSLASSFEAIF